MYEKSKNWNNDESKIYRKCDVINDDGTASKWVKLPDKTYLWILVAPLFQFTVTIPSSNAVTS